MVELSAAARHALALAVIEPSRAARRLADRRALGSRPARQSNLRLVANPLRGNACNSGGLTPATLAPNAEPDTWEEY